MREDNLEEKFIEYANKNLNNLFCPEQDAINVVCYPKIKFMPANAIVFSEAYKNYLYWNYSIVTNAERYKVVKISKNECERLIGFSNNASPAFVISGVGYALFGSIRIGVFLYILSFISSIFNFFNSNCNGWCYNCT